MFVSRSYIREVVLAGAKLGSPKSQSNSLPEMAFKEKKDVFTSSTIHIEYKMLGDYSAKARFALCLFLWL